MGAMKSIHTRMTTSKGSLTAVERHVIQTEHLLRQAEIAQSNTGHSTLADVTLRLEYVGNVPSESGQYLIIDTFTGGCICVVVLVGADANLEVHRFGSSRGVKLADYNQEEYRWFRIPALDSTDMKAVRKLPIA